jgi:hypothetical protein
MPRKRKRRRRVKRGILDAVAVDLSNVEILADLGDTSGWDVVGSSPYLSGSFVMLYWGKREEGKIGLDNCFYPCLEIGGS